MVEGGKPDHMTSTPSRLPPQSHPGLDRDLPSLMLRMFANLASTPCHSFPQTI